MKDFVRCGLALTLVLGASAALGNGVTSERKAGGLVFKKSDSIAIASEELYVSFSELRVAYVY